MPSVSGWSKFGKDLLPIGGKVLRQGIVGGVLGAGGTYAVNKAGDDNYSLGTGFLIGAGAAIGLKAGRTFKNVGNAYKAAGSPTLNLGKNFGSFSFKNSFSKAGDFFSNADKNYNKAFSTGRATGYANSAFDSAVNTVYTYQMGDTAYYMRRAQDAMNSKIPATLSNNMSAFVRGAGHGAIGGAVIGAGYGAFSERESMFGGAFKGAVMGGVAMGVYRRAGLSYARPFRKIASTYGRKA